MLIEERCNPETEKGRTATGDSSVFNGILCASGEKWACEGIWNTMDEYGGLWRAANQRGRVSGYGRPGGGRYSQDQMLGFLVAIVATYKRGNIETARNVMRRWKAWLETDDNHGPKGGIVNGEFSLCLWDFVDLRLENVQRANDLVGAGRFEEAAEAINLGMGIDLCTLEFSEPLFGLASRSALVGAVFDYVDVPRPTRCVYDPNGNCVEVFGNPITHTLGYDAFGQRKDPCEYMNYINKICLGAPNFNCHLAAMASMILQMMGSSANQCLNEVPGKFKKRYNFPDNRSYLQNPFVNWVRNRMESTQEIKDSTRYACGTVAMGHFLNQKTRHIDWHWQRELAGWRKNWRQRWAGWDCVAMINFAIDNQNWIEDPFIDPDYPNALWERDFKGCSLYEHQDFKGSRIDLLPGERGFLGAYDNIASSMIVGEGSRLEIYGDRNLKGESKVYCSGRWPIIDDEYNDTVSYAICERDPSCKSDSSFLPAVLLPMQ